MRAAAMAESKGCAKEFRRVTRGAAVSTSEPDCESGAGENCVAIFATLYTRAQSFHFYDRNAFG